MSDKLHGNVRAGSASVSLPVKLRDSLTVADVLGKIAANVTAYYWRQGGSPVAISVSDLPLLTTVFTAGGWKEMADGIYRLDIPDPAFLTGAEWVIIVVKVTGTLTFEERYNLETHNSTSLTSVLTSLINLVKTVVDGILKIVQSQTSGRR